MNAANAVVDLDDAEGLLDADRDGLLRSAAMAGAQVRTIAAAIEEGALESVASDQRPRTVIWLSGRGPAESAGAILAAALGAAAAQPILTAAQVPSWIGPLDVLVIAGGDPGDPVLGAAAATAVRRGARVVVVAPFEGPLRDAAAGRAAVLAPRLPVPDEFALSRYLAAGLATVDAVGSVRKDSGDPLDLAVLADELDAEALRNGVMRDVFTNPAKMLAGRMSGRQLVLAGDNPATLALARHGGAALLRLGGRPAGAAGLDDALAAVRRAAFSQFADPVFHDDEIDGPLTGRLRVLALTLAAERSMLTARTLGLDGIDLVGVEDVGEAGSTPTIGGRVELQLATLAVRLEMAAVYLRLAGG